MTRRGVLLLGAGAVAAAAAAAAVLATGERTRTEAVLIGKPVFPGIAPKLAEARSIEILRHDATLRIEDKDGVWGLADRGGYPVRPDRVRELFNGLAELKLIEERTGNPELFSRLGLEDVTKEGSTSQLLTVKDGKGQVIAEAILGRRRIRTAGNLPEAIYIRRPGENRSFLAEGQLRADTDPMLWVDREILDIRRQRIATVTVHRDGAEPVTAERRSPDLEAATLIGMPEGFRADQAKVDDLPRALEYLTFNDVRPASQLAEAKPLGEASFTTFDGITVKIRILEADAKRWALFAASWAERARPEAGLQESAAPGTAAPGNTPAGNAQAGNAQAGNAQAEIKPAEEAKAEAEALTRRLSPWAYQLVDWKTDTLLVRPEDVAAPPPSDPS